MYIYMYLYKGGKLIPKDPLTASLLRDLREAVCAVNREREDRPAPLHLLESVPRRLRVI